MELVQLADGRKLELLIEGPADGIPLVFHHGTPGAAVRLSHWPRLRSGTGYDWSAPAGPGTARRRRSLVDRSATWPPMSAVSWTRSVRTASSASASLVAAAFAGLRGAARRPLHRGGHPRRGRAGQRGRAGLRGRHGGGERRRVRRRQGRARTLEKWLTSNGAPALAPRRRDRRLARRSRPGRGPGRDDRRVRRLPRRLLPPGGRQGVRGWRDDDLLLLEPGRSTSPRSAYRSRSGRASSGPDGAVRPRPLAGRPAGEPRLPPGDRRGTHLAGEPGRPDRRRAGPPTSPDHQAAPFSRCLMPPPTVRRFGVNPSIVGWCRRNSAAEPTTSGVDSSNGDAGGPHGLVGRRERFIHACSVPAGDVTKARPVKVRAGLDR